MSWSVSQVRSGNHSAIVLPDFLVSAKQIGPVGAFNLQVFLQAMLRGGFEQRVVIPEQQAEGVQKPFAGIAEGLVAEEGGGAEGAQVEQGIAPARGLWGFGQRRQRVIPGRCKRAIQTTIFEPEPELPGQSCDLGV